MITKRKKILIIVPLLLVLGKMLFSLYEFYFNIPADQKSKIQSQSNYIIFEYKNIEHWYQRYGEPIHKEQTLINDFLLEKSVYNLNQIETNHLFKYSPIEFKIDHKIEIIHVYFYKRFLNLDTIFFIFYNSLIWTLSLIIAILVIFIGLFILFYLLLLFYRMMKTYLSKNLPVVEQPQ